MKILLTLFTLLLTQVYSAQNSSFSEFNYSCIDQVSRPYIVYTPKKIAPNQSLPLLIYLHGSVSSPNLKSDPLGYMKKSKLIELAEEGGFYLMFSYGQKGATWFNHVGTDMILGEVEQVKKSFNVNADKVFLIGFSDGGSGVIYQSMTHPTAFAGFIALNGSLNVAQKLGEAPMFPENNNHLPMYIVNTQNDMLYPINQIKPTIEYLEKYNPNINFVTPKGNHEMSYLKDLTPEILKFIHSNTRRVPYEIRWESTQIGSGYSWLKMAEVDTLQSPKSWHNPYYLEVFNDKANYGIEFDYSYHGKGLKIAKFTSENSAGKKIGLQQGDVVLKMENELMESPYSPYIYLANKRAGDPTSITVLRNNQELVLNGKFNEGLPYTIFSENPHSGKVIASIDGKTLDIKTSRVSSINLDWETLKPLNIKKIILNGKSINYKKIKERNTISVK